MDDDLVFIEREHYTIKISQRIEGHYHCTYRILNDHTHTMVEASQEKILQRLVRTFELYLNDFDDTNRSIIKGDILEISGKIKVSKRYREKIFQVWE